MKSILSVLFVLFATSVVLVVSPAFAQTPDQTMTDQHIARIRDNCQTARVTLSQIHANDAPVYINYNQTYFSISDKLMARLNGRLTLNRYDATQLVKTASDYNNELMKFRGAYKVYDDAMAGLIRMDCTKQPVSFYDAVAAVKVNRQRVHDIALQLNAYIGEYKQEVQLFQTQHSSVLSGVKQ